MLIGPVFTREVAIAPRRLRFYLYRAGYPSALLLLMCTAWQVMAGTRVVEGVGEFASFGAILFQILAPLQLTILLFSAALLAASAVAQEKDRRTLDLLLLTNLTNTELVLGKLLASLLNILLMVGAALPLFLLAMLFGGVSGEQIARVFAVTVASTLAAGSLGSTLALWRDKTFQTIALTGLVLVLWLVVWEGIRAGAFGDQWTGITVESWAVAFSPWQAILAASEPVPSAAREGLDAVLVFPCVAGAIAIALNLLAIARVRVWNPSGEIYEQREPQQQRESIWGAEHDLAAEATAPTSPVEITSANVHSAGGRSRPVWDNPIIWREIRTRAYGRRTYVLRLAYLALCTLCGTALYQLTQGDGGVTPLGATLVLVPLFLLSLALVNAMAVTCITNERDGRSLDLLLVTDLTAKEFIYGKLGGVFYNTKEIILLPVLFCLSLGWQETIGLENLFYLITGLLVLFAFVAMLGIHAGMSYENSRSAIATSLGTVFFLFLGVATCIRVMVAFSGAFEVQLQPFLAFMVGGGVGLFLALGIRNPSTAILVASLLCPFATFYAITCLLLPQPQPLSAFLVTTATYGFTTLALLIPAVYEFDVATGRTSEDGT